VKRDDLTGLGLGGNKLRKLEYDFAAATQSGADVIVSGGVVQSNVARQVAAVSAKLGLECHLGLMHGRLIGLVRSGRFAGHEDVIWLCAAGIRACSPIPRPPPRPPKMGRFLDRSGSTGNILSMALSLDRSGRISAPVPPRDRVDSVRLSGFTIEVSCHAVFASSAP
jgi:hypothetical protein